MSKKSLDINIVKDILDVMLTFRMLNISPVVNKILQLDERRNFVSYMNSRTIYLRLEPPVPFELVFRVYNGDKAKIQLTLTLLVTTKSWRQKIIHVTMNR